MAHSVIYMAMISAHSMDCRAQNKQSLHCVVSTALLAAIGIWNADAAGQVLAFDQLLALGPSPGINTLHILNGASANLPHSPFPTVLELYKVAGRYTIVLVGGLGTIEAGAEASGGLTVYWGEVEQPELASALIELVKAERNPFILDGVKYSWVVEGSMVKMSQTADGVQVATITRGQGLTSAVDNDGMVHWTCIVVAAVLEASGWEGFLSSGPRQHHLTYGEILRVHRPGGLRPSSLRHRLSSLRFLLQLASEFFRTIDHIISTLERISGRLEFYQMYATVLYVKSELVQKALADTFMTKTNQPRSASRVALKMLNPCKTFFSQAIALLERNETRLNFCTTQVDRMLDYEWRRVQTEVAETGSQDARSRETQQIRRTESRENRQAFLHAISPRTIAQQSKPHQLQLIMSSEHRSGTWLLNHPEFLAWKTGDESLSPILWLKGIPGSGKTVLAWLRHCLSNRPSFPRPHNFFNSDKSRKLLRFIVDIACCFRQPYIVIDALDECDLESLHRLLSLFNHIGNPVRILVTSRDHPDIRTAFRNTPTIEVSPSAIEEDIRHFVQQKVYEDEAFLHIRDPRLRETIVETLVQGANGMFLLPFMQLSRLSEQRTDHDIQAILETLPPDLKTTYLRCVQHIDALDAARRRRAQRVLRWTICASNPLSLPEIATAISIDDMQEEWDASRLVSDIDERTMIGDCGNLVISEPPPFNEFLPFKVARLFHATVKDFLVQTPAALGFPEKRTDPILESSIAVLESTLRYLKLHYDCLSLDQYINRRWFDDDLNLITAPENCTRDALFQRRECQECQNNSSPFREGYIFNQFGAQMRNVGEAACRLVAQWCEVIDLIIVNLELPLDMARECKKTRLVQATILMNQPVLLDAILQADPSACFEADSHGNTPLHIAAHHQITECVPVLLRHGANPNATNDKDWTPLHAATTAAPFVQWERTTNLLQALLGDGAHINAEDQDGRTALHLAARRGSVMTVRFLLDNGAAPSKRDSHGKTASQLKPSVPQEKILLRAFQLFHPDYDILASLLPL
ncbi:hypothetical protein C8J56DRAFT_1166307 [Mycena floridula]|nr:hypothetical protein C8J56DRAFT_1166307 [Mycena floridula]